jgi:hypothetical protein
MRHGERRRVLFHDTEWRNDCRPEETTAGVAGSTALPKRSGSHLHGAGARRLLPGGPEADSGHGERDGHGERATRRANPGQSVVGRSDDRNGRAKHVDPSVANAEPDTDHHADRFAHRRNLHQLVRQAEGGHAVHRAAAADRHAATDVGLLHGGRAWELVLLARNRYRREAGHRMIGGIRGIEAATQTLRPEAQVRRKGSLFNRR